LKLGRIPFINMAPFYHFLGARWLEQHELSLGNPRQLGTLARAGKLDAAPFSYVDGLELVASGEYEWLDALGIAGRGPIRSILLVGCEDPKALAGQAIAVTPQTSTTVKLMETWLRERVGVKDYRLTGPDDNAAARLLIGDEALRRRLEQGDKEPQIDLCEAWTDWTGHAFLFARWAVHKGLPLRAKAELALTLRSALDLGLEDLAHVAQAQAERSGLPAKEIEAYLRGIRFHLSKDELDGAKAFEERLKAL
jgi:predicted solute-binding protein